MRELGGLARTQRDCRSAISLPWPPAFSISHFRPLSLLAFPLATFVGSWFFFLVCFASLLIGEVGGVVGVYALAFTFA